MNSNFLKYKERIPKGTLVKHPCDCVPFVFLGINENGKPILEGDWSGGTAPYSGYSAVSWCEWEDVTFLNEDVEINNAKDFFYDA